jgi:hypothetical protein
VGSGWRIATRLAAAEGGSDVLWVTGRVGNMARQFADHEVINGTDDGPPDMEIRDLRGSDRGLCRRHESSGLSTRSRRTWRSTMRLPGRSRGTQVFGFNAVDGVSEQPLCSGRGEIWHESDRPMAGHRFAD